MLWIQVQAAASGVQLGPRALARLSEASGN